MDCTFSTIELHPPPPGVYVHRTRAYIIRESNDRETTWQARLSLRNREVKLFSRFLHKCVFARKVSGSNQRSSLIDAMVESNKKHTRVKCTIKSGNLSSITAVRAYTYLCNMIVLYDIGKHMHLSLLCFPN